jgi:anaerobic ribonucleoside-triphosphate reductase
MNTFIKYQSNSIMVITIGDIGKACPRCGKFFLGNRCPNCGWEVLEETAKTINKEERMKKVHR